MSKRILTIDTTTQLNQSKASEPKHSAWVSANAGSGKTTVLARRVVRLLLNGTDPARILCLTFTKAAAGEMANRVFEILGRWATAPDDALMEELTKTEDKRPTDQQFERARTLFARALETPGGLKIQTIHAFCEALLHQFPLEANIPGNFSVMDDAAQKQFMEQARRKIILDADADEETPVGRAFAAIMEAASDHAIDKAFGELIKNRDAIASWLAETGGPVAAEGKAREQFNFSPDDTVENLFSAAVSSSVFNRLDLKLLIEVFRAANQSGADTAANALERFFKGSVKERFDALKILLLTGKGEARKFGRYPPKAVHEAWPGIRDIFEIEANSLLENLARINTLKVIEQTTPLMVIAEAMINHYKMLKRQNALLDFDDLVSRTADLLTKKSARSWVLYKLDLGIDHILLDEAQDTSPQQWRIISSLVEEFFSGESARPANRTVFAVGDEKQSIYSFQGAEPSKFVEQRRNYGQAANNANKEMLNVSLGLSFRSTQDVLSAVDTVFDHEDNATGLTFGDDYTSHTAARQRNLGSVEVWPLQIPEAADDAPDWATPQDQSQSRHQAVLLANRIADRVKHWLDNGERLEADGKLISAGDILVLVRSRDRFMTALGRALKDRDIPVAGADRLALTNHIAVKDLLALGQIMLTPDDDLSLACVLKSPLLNITEEQLYTLARFRLRDSYEISLFDALREVSEDPTFEDHADFDRAYTKLIAWRDRADSLPIYEFYARILGADHGRQDFYARLGAEAEDVLDAFLDKTLTHEQSGLPGLQAFLEALSSDSPEIKREMDQTSGQVRIMTVHASKGLEAPIVFVADNCGAAYQGTHAAALYRWGNMDEDTANPYGFLWVAQAEQHGHVTAPLRDEAKQKAHEEYRRLLYVAMTRAEDRLIVCGYKGGKNPTKPNWHTMVSDALEDSWVEKPDDVSGETFYQWNAARDGADPLPPVHHQEEVAERKNAAPNLPGWVGHNLPTEIALPRPLNPSGAQAIIDEALVREKSAPSLLRISDADGVEPDAGESSRLRGTALHRLLQILPDSLESARENLARSYLERAIPNITTDAMERLVSGVTNTLAAPELSAYFNPETSRAEVPVMGRIDLASGPRSISGTIDRLAILPDHVMLLDYKTSSFAPPNLSDVSDDYITQMSLYRALVTKLYPDREIRASLVWTHAPLLRSGNMRISHLPSSVMDEAFTKIAGL